MSKMITETSRNPIRMVRDAAFSIKGNARACVFMEPLFAIPNTMYSGYMTLYMLALGVTKSQVGMITSLGLAVHLFFALISAYVTDRLGRRYATLVFDSIGWGAAQIVWAFAGNINFFIAAAVINGFSRIVHTSWQCLMVEDSEPDIRVHIFNFIQIAGILAGFFAPVGALLVNRLTLVPAMRVMMAISLVSMAALFGFRHLNTKETSIGRLKMLEAKDVSIASNFKAYLPALRRIMGDRLLILVLLVRSLNFIQLTIRTTFLSVLLTERFNFPAEIIAVFHTVNAVVILFALVFITPLLARYTRRWPISLGIWFHIAALAFLLLAPPGRNYPLLIISSVLIAFGTSVATPRIDTLVANTISNEERSVVNALISVILLLLSTPFGFIGGVLSGIDVRLPFLMTLILFFMCLALLRVATVIEGRRRKEGARDG